LYDQQLEYAQAHAPTHTQQEPAYDEFFLELVQDDLNRRKFQMKSLDSLDSKEEKSANLNAKFFGQQQYPQQQQQQYPQQQQQYPQQQQQYPQQQQQQQLQPNTMAGNQQGYYNNFGAANQQQQQQQFAPPAEKVTTLSSMQHQPFMQQQAGSPNGFMQQMSKIFI
jgi:hypothetical protein